VSFSLKADENSIALRHPVCKWTGSITIRALLGRTDSMAVVGSQASYRGKYCDPDHSVIIRSVLLRPSGSQLGPHGFSIVKAGLRAPRLTPCNALRRRSKNTQ
jgi:hypothetical protein